MDKTAVEASQKAVEEFTRKITGLYATRLNKVVLYGSWARGDATEDSDIDLLVVFAGQVVPGLEIDRMIDIVTDINLEYNVLLAVYPVSEHDYATLNSPLLLNIRREGIPA